MRGDIWIGYAPMDRGDDMKYKRSTGEVGVVIRRNGYAAARGKGIVERRGLIKIWIRDGR